MAIQDSNLPMYIISSSNILYIYIIHTYMVVIFVVYISCTKNIDFSANIIPTSILKIQVKILLTLHISMKNW